MMNEVTTLRYRFFFALRRLRVRLFSCVYIAYLRLLGSRVPFSARFYSAIEIRGAAHSITVGRNVVFQTRVCLSTGLVQGKWGTICIGDNVSIGDGVIISATHSITIGERSSIAAYCYLVDHDHPTVDKSAAMAPITVGRNVWFGTHAVVLKGVEIGSDSVIGAGSVVTKSVPDKSVVAGVPGRLLRQMA